ncbi:MAG: YdcF family protein [Nitrospira sp.]|nr:YdcF family protein [Nitrospira sp.]
MMYLHKILPALLLPIGIVLVVLTAALVTKRRGFIAAGLALLLLFSTPLVSNLLFRSIENYEARPVIAALPSGDAIVVLSGMLTTAPLAGGGIVSEWTDPDRFFAGVELLKAGKAPLLIFTGGQLPWLPNNPPEGTLLKPFAAQMGIPLERITVTPVVENTEDEAREVRRHLGPGKKVILVTSAFHFTRARQLFTAQGIEVIPFPVDFNGDTTRPWTILDVIPTASGLWKSETAIREWPGRAFYAVKLTLFPAS